ALRPIRGTTRRPRLAVCRSSKHIVVQLDHDSKGHTLAAASSREPDLRDSEGTKTDKAVKAGQLTAQRAKDAGVVTVVFDRGGNKYTGRIAALAEAAREGGLEF